MTKLQVIIFDMDGLLIDSEQVYYSGSQKIADDYQLDYTKETYLRGIGISDEELYAWYHELYDEIHGKEHIDGFIQDSYAYCLTLFDQGAAKLKQGVIEVLDFCAQHQIKTCVASSNNRMLVEKLLEKQGILSRFDAIFTADDVENAKPEPDLFLAAAAYFHVDNDAMLVLEDSHNGIIAANRAQISVIMIPDLLPPAVDMEMEAVLESLTDIPNYLITHEWI